LEAEIGPREEVLVGSRVAVETSTKVLPWTRRPSYHLDVVGHVGIEDLAVADLVLVVVVLASPLMSATAFVVNDTRTFKKIATDVDGNDLQV
jgi:hypothetical protein